MDAHQVNAEKLYLTPFPFSPLFEMLLLSLASQKHSPNTKRRFKEEYDYVIVGGGSAGSVLAARLSEMPCVSVLLLEAGKSPPMLTDVPSVAGSFILSDIDWKFRTVPQQFTGAGLINKQVPLPSAKTLGGGSTINALIANRGNRKNYDEWAALGATGWSYNDVFPYFLRLEDNADLEALETGFHARGGPLDVERPRYHPEVRGSIIESALSLGYQFVDVDGPRQHGFWDHQGSLRRSQRCSTAKAYLVPSENRTNLDILARALVTKIKIENGRATGVEFDFNGRRQTVKAKREVISSAGAIGTAKLLILSGIGPLHDLVKLKIPFVADLPVGGNLQDHQAGFIAFELSESIKEIHKRLFDEKNIRDYIEHRIGPLVSTSGINLLAFLSNNKTGEENDVPDHLLYFIEMPALLANLRVGFTPQAYKQVFGPYEKKPILVCMAQILHPKSRGTVKLRSRSPYEFPDIDPNYFADPYDLADVVEGLKTCVKLLSTPPMAKVGSEIFNTTFPGCEPFHNDLHLRIMCTVKSAVMSVSHPAGTAKMGDPNDPSTVVDPELRVKGVKGLRVVDASVMPTITWGNTNIPTIMIAEKASDIIKGTISC